MTTYGHFTLKNYEERKDNPFLEQHGHWYRITETYLVRALDRVNYQAEECEAREVEAWLAEKVVAVAEPESELEPEPETGADFENFLDELEENYPPPETDEWTPVVTEAEHREVPSLADWAREHGWAGVGRISQKLREAYRAEFGE